MTRLKKQITHHSSQKAYSFTLACTLAQAQDTNRHTDYTLTHTRTHTGNTSNVLISLLQHIMRIH